MTERHSTQPYDDQSGEHGDPADEHGRSVEHGQSGQHGQSGEHRDVDSEHNVRELLDVPSVEVISRAAVMLMSSAAEKLGLAEEDPENTPARDLDEARRLITALAGLVTASVEYLGIHAAPIRDGLQSLQRAFREASAVPDPPGQGPGEKYTGPVH